MTDILCNWLNDEVNLSKKLDKSQFAEDFASGFYLGEILHKFQLQHDFDKFSAGQTADAKLNNFTRLEPVLHLLEIPFDTNIAYDIMMMRHGTATRLLYQMYIALHRKVKSNLTGAAMESMRPSAPVKLEQIESGLYKERLKTLLPRESDLILEKVSTKFQAKRKDNERKALDARYKEMEKYNEISQQQRQAALEKSRVAKQKQTEILAKIQAATVHIPKPPPTKTLKVMNMKRELRQRREAELVRNEIKGFESNLTKLVAPTSSQTDQSDGGDAGLQNSIEYLQQIKTRLEEDSTARDERAKRRRKVLVDQMKAHHAQEESLRQEQVVQRLMRQSQQERRIAVQLMQARREKDVIRKNRIFQEKQVEARRLQDFQDALDKEAALNKLAKEEYEEEIQRELELHQRIRSQHAHEKYRQHYNFCQEVLNAITDFACKIAEYRELTDKKVPEKLVREWRDFVIMGKPLYISSDFALREKIELEKENLLDDQDFSEYKNMVGEWKPLEDTEISQPANNNILGHILHRMFSIVAPTPPPTPPPVFPEFPIRVAVLGKMFAGKSSIISSLVKQHRIVQLSMNEILSSAVDALSEGNEEDEQSDDLANQNALAEKAVEHLKKGEIVPNEILVDLLVDRIHKIPAGTGWILDGFPTNIEQALLLEKALTGSDVSYSRDKKDKRKSSVVSDPKPVKAKPATPPGLHMVVHLDVSDATILSRACGRTYGTESGETFHTEYEPPPFGSHTGLGKVDQIKNVQDPAFEHEQVQHRITSFHSNWEKMEKLYSEITTVQHVDAEAAKDTVYAQLEKTVFSTLNKIQEKSEEEFATELSDKLSEEIPKEDVKPQRSDLLRPDSASSRKSKDSVRSARSKTKSGKGSARDRKKSGEKTDKKSRSRSASSKSSKDKRKSATPPPAAVPEVVEPEEVNKPKPGDQGWEYVKEELPLTLVHSSVPYWKNAEMTYIKSCKFVFREIRMERESIIRYLYEIRQDFQLHLRRPDHKQTFVTAWHHDYNSVAEDLRKDEETQAELHQRLDDLREKLWDICDTRKEEVEVERSNLISEGWLQDHLGILTNLYLTLMQGEIDRFEDTARIVKDYYSGMRKSIPGENVLPGMLPRLPLVEHDVGVHGVSTVQSTLTVGSENPSISPQSSQSDTKKLSTKQSEEATKDNEPTKLAQAGSRTKIPLIQRGVTFSNQLAEDGGKGKKGKPPAPVGSDSPVQDDKLEEKTVEEAFNFAASAIAHVVQVCINAKEAEEEEERLQKEEAEKAKAALIPVDKKGGGGKKGGGKSAKGKKGGKGGKSKSPTPTPPTPVEEESEEEKKKRETAARLKEEYFAVLQQEETAAKDRLKLIKTRSIHTLSDLYGKSELTFTDMNDWIGSRYLREMAAIDNLSSVVRQCIEEGVQLEYELLLEQDEFVINHEAKVIRTPSPPPRPEPIETSQPDVFTIVQLGKLYSHFKGVAPNGMILNKAFIEVLADTAALDAGADALPDMWINISYNQLVELADLLSGESEYIDWRKFLLLAAFPWQQPTTEELLVARSAFQQHDVCGNGWISKDQFLNVKLWLDDSGSSKDPDVYDRNRHFSEFCFTLFSDWEQTPPRLDYVNMLMYFAMDKNTVTGFLRALSVASGKAMPSYTKKLIQSTEDLNKNSVPGSDRLLELSPSKTRGIKLELETNPSPEISAQDWWSVLHHGSSRLGDSHRFAEFDDPKSQFSMPQLHSLYEELESDEGSTLPMQTLILHPVLQDAILGCKKYQFLDIRSVFHGDSSAYDADTTQFL
ncbi:sperm flagellar protein 2-like [Ciona intestinalis]